MYAYDTVLFSETAIGLQRMLDALHMYSSEWGLTVNAKKTKVVVFRNSWQLNPNDVWLYNGDAIEIVNTFKYLGMLFSYNGKFNITQKQLSEQGRKAMFLLMREIHQHNFNIDTLLHLFNTYVGSILNYASEVWGFHKAPDIEKVHLSYLKRILCVKRSTASAVVYRELGRLSMQTHRKFRILKYWLKISSCDNIIIRTIYNIQFEDSNGINNINWLSSVKSLLCDIGMYEVWLDQGHTINKQYFLRMVRERLSDNFIQSVESLIQESTKCLLYKHLVDTWVVQPYLCEQRIPEYYRKAITKIRLSSHKLSVESGRFNNIERENRVCTMCNSHELEDEYHFILTCPRYRELRAIYIKRYYVNRPSMFKMTELFKSENPSILCNLGKYIVKALHLRSSLI